MNNIIKKYVDKMGKLKMSIYLIVILMFLLIICTITLEKYSESVTNALSDKVMRFHVVANSDSTEDQLLKQQVKDEVIAYMEPILKTSKSIEETRELIKRNLGNIEEITETVVRKWNKEYNIYAVIDYSNFPTKSYGDVVLPSGEYEACRIIIGEGKGENWWCVMFPPLCYVDAATGVVPIEGKEQLEKELNEEQYKLITENNNGPYKIRFKLVDTVNSYFHKSNYKEQKK